MRTLRLGDDLPIEHNLDLGMAIFDVACKEVNLTIAFGPRVVPRDEAEHDSEIERRYWELWRKRNPAPMSIQEPSDYNRSIGS